MQRRQSSQGKPSIGITAMPLAGRMALALALAALIVLPGCSASQSGEQASDDAPTTVVEEDAADTDAADDAASEGDAAAQDNAPDTASSSDELAAAQEVAEDAIAYSASYGFPITFDRAEIEAFDASGKAVSVQVFATYMPKDDYTGTMHWSVIQSSSQFTADIIGEDLPDVQELTIIWDFPSLDGSTTWVYTRGVDGAMEIASIESHNVDLGGETDYVD